MAFPNSIRAPVGTWQGPIPVVPAVCPMTGKSYHNIFEGSRYMGMHPHYLGRVGVAMGIARYVTTDPFKAESHAGKLLPLSKKALDHLLSLLRDGDVAAGRPHPSW